MLYRECDIPEHLLKYFENSDKYVSISNNHPTVKPISLMRELVKLITPKGGVCIEPFAGSGTTLIACELEDIDYVAIEQEKEYVYMCKKRTEHVRRCLNK